jgi:predicted ATPase
VELAAVHDPVAAAAELCSRLGVPRSSDDALEDLAQALRARELLLVLDNLEQLREGDVARGAAAPNVRPALLVTSRVVLHLSGEHVYPVDPLAEDDAAALLVERAGSGVVVPEQDDVLRRLCGAWTGFPSPSSSPPRGCAASVPTSC